MRDRAGAMKDDAGGNLRRRGCAAGRDAVGNLLDENGGFADLLKAGKEAKTTLGMHIALNSGVDTMAPTQIQSVIPGGPAHLSGKIMRGDWIIKVDGIEVDENNIVPRVRGIESLGSPCLLTLKRGEIVFDVELFRASSENVGDMSALFDLFDDLELKICELGSDSTLQILQVCVHRTCARAYAYVSAFIS